MAATASGSRYSRCNLQNKEEGERLLCVYLSVLGENPTRSNLLPSPADFQGFIPSASACSNPHSRFKEAGKVSTSDLQPL